MSVLNGIFPGKVIVVKSHKLKKKNFEALKKIYPTAFFVTNREEINELKTIFYVEDSNIEDIDKFFFKQYDIIQYNPIYIEETKVIKRKLNSSFMFSKYREENFKMYEV